MKEKKIFIVVLILACLLTLSGCIGIYNKVELVGELKTVSYDESLDSITLIKIDDINLKDQTLNVSVVESSEKYIKVTAPENFFDDLVYKKINNKLNIYAKQNSLYYGSDINIEIGFNNLKKLDIENASGSIDGKVFKDDAIIDLSGESSFIVTDIDVKSLEIEASGYSSIDFDNIKVINGEIELSGTSVVDIKKLDVAEKMSFEFSGLSKINTDNINAKELEFDFSGNSKATNNNIKVTESIKIKASGSSVFNFSGEANKLDCDFSGDSEIKAFDLIINEAEIEASGDTEFKLNIIDKLSVDLSGSSVVKYKGRPVIGDISTSGSSKIEWVE